MGKDKEIYSFALEDDLFLHYHWFMHPGTGEYDKDLVKQLLSYHIYPFIYNIAQAKRTGLKLSYQIQNQLHHKTYRDHDLETLADETEFKCILSSSKCDFPYINIYDDKIKTTLGGTFFHTENREKAKRHINKLCRKARNITIFDKYLTEEDARNLCQLFPKERNLTIHIHNKNIEDKGVPVYGYQAIAKIFNNADKQWEVEGQELLVNSHHDRYIVIDDSLAIVLTSGVANLFSNDRDFTYVITPIKNNMLLRAPSIEPQRRQ